MSRSYFTENQKTVTMNFPRWTIDECYTIREILYNKEYYMNCVTRIGADKKPHDAWQIERADAPRIVEQLMRQRIVAEFQGEGHGLAAVIFSCGYHADTIISAVKRFQKNNRGD